KQIIMKKVLLGLMILGLFSGCLKEEKCSYNECGTVAPAAEIQAVKDYLTSQNITATQHCSGMFYTIDNAGSGTAPNFCSTVAVTYEGKLTNGTVFDKATSPVAFNLSQVVTGFRNGIPLVKTGGRVHLYLPPSLAYGSCTNCGVPANSILIFDVTLTGVQ
ncbi:MAG TPA: FKBP-type peptidyl-prolyl cis-trans isomerase, partial [Flavisolibacter sp.]|nr:FKBP-type peptidyl-prolyl cis-trans isomerase [Flavisolibacter sp.]